MILSGIKVFADVMNIKTLQVISLKPMTEKYPVKDRKEDTERHRGEGHVKTEADIAVICPEAKNSKSH